MTHETGGRRASVGVAAMPFLRVLAVARFRLALALVVLGVALYFAWLGLDGFRSMQDFRNEFVPVARLAWSGVAPFKPVPMARPGSFMAGGGTSVYTPPFLLLMWPWTLLPTAAGEAAWFALELGAVVGMLALVYARIGAPSTAELASVVAVILVLMPFRDSLNDGQVSLGVGFLVCVALWAHQGRNAILGGLALGIATAVKITPVGAMAYFAWRRDWALVGVSMVVLAVLALATIMAGWAGYWPGFFHNLAAVSSGTANTLNQSLNGLVLRLLHPEWTGQPIPPLDAGVRAPWLVLQVAVATVALMVARRGPRDNLDEWAMYACLLLALPLVSPFAWPHHYAQALVAVPVVTRLMLLRRLSAAATLVAVGMFLALAFLEVPLTAAGLAEGANLARHPELAVGASLLVFAALATMGVLARARGAGS